jgi:hypothetical protein
MEFSKGTVGVIAAFCVAVGAGGAYLVSGTGSRAVTVPETVATAFPEAPAAPISEFTAGTTATAQPVAAPATTAPAVRRPAAAREPQTRASTPSETLVAPPTQPDPARSPEPQATPAPAPEPPTVSEPEPLAAAEPPAREFEELVIPGDSVIGLQIETSTTSDSAEIEDLVIAHVTRDVRVGGQVAIPAGAKVHGLVTLVERGGRLRERARLGVRFTSVVLGDGTRVLLESETVYREGDPPSRESAAKIGGGAIGGAIIGGILGGAKGAAIGGSVGAGAGTAAVLAGGRNAATLPSGTPVTVRLTDVAIVTVDRQ